MAHATGSRFEDEEYILFMGENIVICDEREAVAVPIATVLSVIHRDAPKEFAAWLRKQPVVVSITFPGLGDWKPRP